jgi:hypothetical protein
MKRRTAQEQATAEQVLQDAFRLVETAATLIPRDGWRFVKDGTTTFNIRHEWPVIISGRIYAKSIQLQTSPCWSGKHIKTKVPSTTTAEELGQILTTQFVEPMAEEKLAKLTKAEEEKGAREYLLDHLRTIEGLDCRETHFSTPCYKIPEGGTIIDGRIYQDGSGVRDLSIGNVTPKQAAEILQALIGDETGKIKIVFGSMDVFTADKIVRTALS